MSIFELMAHYIPHGNWRTRLAMNGAATNIWMCWVLSVGCLITAIVLFIRAEALLNALVFLGVGAALFTLSFIFLPEAKRLHEIKRIMQNEILFGETTKDV